MEDQYATPSALSCVSNNDDELDMYMEGDNQDGNEYDGSTPGGSSQNEGGLQGYTSPQETGPSGEIQEDMYYDESHQDGFPETPKATADIDDNFESILGKHVEWLNDEQASLNERQEHVHNRGKEIVAEAAKHVYQKLLPQLEKTKGGLKTSHQLLEKMLSPPLKTAVTRASQSPLDQGIDKNALKRRLEGALQALDTALQALHGIETPAQECREMQRAASYEEQNNALTVPLSACPDAAGIGNGNGRTNNSSLTGQINSFHFNTADAGSNNMDQFSDFLHLPIASDGNGNMTSNTGQLHSPMLGWGNQPATYAF